MLAHCLRHLANIEPALSQHPHPVIPTLGSLQTQGVDPMLVQCWPVVCDAGPTLGQRLVFSATLFNQTIGGAGPTLNQDNVF